MRRIAFSFSLVLPGLLLVTFSPIATSAQHFTATLDAPVTPPAPLVYIVAEKPPPFSTRRIAGQIALGTVTGLAGGLTGGFIGVTIEDCSDGDWLCGLGGALLGGTVGLLVGSSAGVYAAGRTETVAIGYGRTLLGSVAGFGTGILLLGALGGGDNDLAFIAILVSPAVGATLLGNTSRRYRAGHGPNGLLNWDDGQFHLGLPALQQQPLGGVPQTFVRSVRLLEVRW